MRLKRTDQGVRPVFFRRQALAPDHLVVDASEGQLTVRQEEEYDSNGIKEGLASIEKMERSILES